MKYIIMRNRGFGDVIWTEPVVRYFLSQQEEVAFYTIHPCIFDNYPSNRLYVNQFSYQFPQPEHTIELEFGKMPHMLILDCYRRQAGVPKMELSLPRLYLSEKEKQRKIKKCYAILHLDFYKQKLHYRNVYGVDWDKVISYLRGQGLEVIQISRHGKQLFAPWLPTPTIRDVMSLMLHCKLFVGLDSGPSHIADVMRIPSVIFFGSVNPKYRHLDDEKKVFLQSPCPFAHCYHQYMDYEPSCRIVSPKGTPPCAIHDTSRVIEAIRSLF